MKKGHPQIYGKWLVSGFEFLHEDISALFCSEKFYSGRLVVALQFIGPGLLEIWDLQFRLSL